MDVNTLRIAVTLVSFVTFVGIMVWAWSRRNAASLKRQPAAIHAGLMRSIHKLDKE